MRRVASCGARRSSSRSSRSRAVRGSVAPVQHDAEDPVAADRVDRALRPGRTASIRPRRRARRRRPSPPSRFASGSSADRRRVDDDPVERLARLVDQPPHALRREAAPSDRTSGGRPAASSDAVDTCWTGSLRSLGSRSALRSGRTRCRHLNTVCSDGRRRSASISSTLRWYDSLSVSARFEAVSVLPSPARRWRSSRP